MRGVLLACLIGGSLGAAACLLELDNEIACGDGYADPNSGEECDPGDLESFRLACGGRPGSCNPDSCTLECCGDGMVNGSEECDGPDLGLASPGGEPTEENDCRALTVPGTDVVYASGNAGCTDECRFDRSQCSLCGNGQVDPAFVYPDTTVLPAEICDGGLVRLEELWSVCAPACNRPSNSAIVCNVICNGCRLLTMGDPIDCCLPKGSLVEDGIPCCCALDPRGCKFDITPVGAEPACTGTNSE